MSVFGITMSDIV